MKILKIAGASALAAVAAVSTSAYAVLPASVGTSITGIQTDGQAIFDLIFPVVAVFHQQSLIKTLRLREFCLFPRLQAF